jgi:hypothetical protein
MESATKDGKHMAAGALGVTLDTIGQGALVELFDAELARVLENIQDPNTDAKTKRTISVKVTFAPNENRDVTDVNLTCGSKLAGIKTVSTRLFVGKVKGQLVAVEHDPRQGALFDAPRPAPAPVAVGEFPQRSNEGQVSDGR